MGPCRSRSRSWRSTPPRRAVASRDPGGAAIRNGRGRPLPPGLPRKRDGHRPPSADRERGSHQETSHPRTTEFTLNRTEGQSGEKRAHRAPPPPPTASSPNSIWGRDTLPRMCERFPLPGRMGPSRSLRSQKTGLCARPTHRPAPVQAAPLEPAAARRPHPATRPARTWLTTVGNPLPPRPRNHRPWKRRTGRPRQNFHAPCSA